MTSQWFENLIPGEFLSGKLTDAGGSYLLASLLALLVANVVIARAQSQQVHNLISRCSVYDCRIRRRNGIFTVINTETISQSVFPQKSS